MFKFLKPPVAATPVPERQQDETYKKLRLQVFIGIFLGYAGYYLLRKNFSIAMPYLADMGFSKAELGVCVIRDFDCLRF